MSALQWQAVCTEEPGPALAAEAVPAALRRVRAHIEAHLAEKVELRGLAALAGLSACHFARAFKQSLGVPPHRYLMRRRVTTAAALIELTGEAPRAYRRRHR